MQAESCPLSVAIGRSLPSRNLPSIWEGGRDSKQKVSKRIDLVNKDIFE